MAQRKNKVEESYDEEEEEEALNPRQFMED